MAEEKKQEQEKKIIVDDDWKQQAQKEKEDLKAQEQVEKDQDQQQKSTGPLPKGDFAALLSMLATQAMFAMGALEVEGQKREPDLEMARYNIDMLETLEEKCKGNLSEAEEKMLSGMLNQIRMGYVQMAG
ncbi:MAG: DUF1844 domain-containing protein [Planctomycetota bacterium]|jgi:hypothetical protein